MPNIKGHSFQFFSTTDQPILQNVEIIRHFEQCTLKFKCDLSKIIDNKNHR